MNDDKSEKISISIPSGLLAALDAHETNRSSYVQRLVTADLQAAGKLPGSPAEEARKTAEAVIVAFADPQAATAEFRKLLLVAARKGASRAKTAA